MRLSDQKIIRAAPDKVFAALTDTEVLRKCIPGCESLEKITDTEMSAKVTLKIGPVKASFKGAVTLSNMNPPHGFTISGQGSGPAAGFAKGSADVKLKPHCDGTELSYEVKAQVGGKIAQLGARLIDGTAKKLAGQFFEKFAETFAPQELEKVVAKAKPARKGWSKCRWLAVAACIALVLVLLAIWF